MRPSGRCAEKTVTKLLDDIIEAHGGAHRARFERIEADVVTTGGLFPLKGRERRGTGDGSVLGEI